MRTTDLIRRAGRSLRQAKARTLLTSLAIAVGSFTIAASLAAGEGARQYADTIIRSNVDPSSIYVSAESVGDTFSSASGLQEYSSDTTQYGGATYKTLNADDIATLKAIDGVEGVLPVYLVNAQYVTFQGIDQKYTSDITTYDTSVLASTAAGTLPELGTQIGDDEIVIPESYVKTLEKTPEEMIGTDVTLRLVKAGKEPTDAEVQAALTSGGEAALQALYAVETRDITFKIVAVSEQSTTSLTATAALFLSDHTAEELSNYLTEGTSQYQQYVAATAKVKEGVDPSAIKAEIEKKDMSAMTAEDISAALFTFVNVLQGIVMGFGVLALIASIFGIINTQYISVLERTQQIGLMKALGMRGRDVAKLFRYEAAWIGFLGGAIGAALAWAIGTASNPWITETLKLGEGNYLLIFVWWQIAALLVGLIIVAIVAGWFPARKAAKLDPIEALRTE